MTCQMEVNDSPALHQGKNNILLQSACYKRAECNAIIVVYSLITWWFYVLIESEACHLNITPRRLPFTIINNVAHYGPNEVPLSCVIQTTQNMNSSGFIVDNSSKRFLFINGITVLPFVVFINHNIYILLTVCVTSQNDSKIHPLNYA